jgi:hypothetical protein
MSNEIDLDRSSFPLGLSLQPRMSARRGRIDVVAAGSKSARADE